MTAGLNPVEAMPPRVLMYLIAFPSAGQRPGNSMRDPEAFQSKESQTEG
jgi:hypothetical protein